MDFFFWASLSAIFYIYFGYEKVLKITNYFQHEDTLPKSLKSKPIVLPTVTVLLTVYNEEEGISDRLDDLIEQNYPEDKMVILVASDHSTDKTEQIVLSHRSSQIRLFSPKKSTGKSDTQNQAIQSIKSDIVVFTDCDTRFEKNCILELVAPYEDKDVGCTTGELNLGVVKNGNISESQSRYWNYELRVRRLESKLGILAVATGACMSVRRDIFTPFSGTFGEDCMVPLDTVNKGLRVKNVEKAIAFDSMPSSQNEEFRARIRMTLRNWQGTWSKSSLLNYSKSPGYAFSLWSHKILRWLSPFFIIILAVSSFSLAHTSIAYSFFSLLLAIFFMISVYGFVANKRGYRLATFFQGVYSFSLANAGFLIGLWLVFTGKTISKYKL